jgi:phospholipid/cholesterol/gamma-HCH transport system permease protein
MAVGSEPLPLRFLGETGQIALFTGRILRRGFAQPPRWDAVIEEMYNVGVKALPVLLAVSIFVGSNTALQGYHAFKALGGQSLVGMFVALAGIRELAPLIAGAIIAAKAGTEMTTTLAMMRNTEQIDALEVMGINPYWYLVAPRLLAITFILPILAVLADFVCFTTGFTIAVVQLQVDPGAFLDTAFRYISMIDVGYSIVKASTFGVIICVIGCYYGFNTRRGPLGVGQAANRAIVLMMVLCVLANYFLSEVLYG